MGALAGRVSPLLEPGPAIAAAGLLAAVAVGTVLAADARIGFALLLALCFAVVAVIDLPLGLALWVPFIFLEGIPAFNLAGKAAGVLLVVAWVGNLGERRAAVRAAIATNRGSLVALVALVVWLTLSLAWADDVGLAAAELWQWGALLVMFLLVMTTVTTERTLRWVLMAFVAGAVLSVVIGVADGSFTGEADGGARLEGGAGDPNYLAASIVAAAVIAVSLLALRISTFGRWLLAAALAVLVVGLVSSGSRGGFLAAAAALVLSLIAFKNRRASVLAVTALVLGAGALAFLNVPGAWDRVTDFDDNNGRSSLWTVGARMWEDAPVTGVGLNNFFTHSGEYIREPGTLEHVQLVVEQPHVPHNTYLQILAENGIVGLALFLALCGGCLATAVSTARRLDARANFGLATVSRGVIVATASILAASMFLSAATDKRLWLLLALSAALAASTSARSGERSRALGSRPGLEDLARAPEAARLWLGRP